MQDMPQSHRTEENVSKDWLWILATEIFEIKIRVNATFIHRDPKHYLVSQGGYVRRSTGQEENVKIYFMCYLSHTEKNKEQFLILRIKLTQNLHLACVCVSPFL